MMCAYTTMPIILIPLSFPHPVSPFLFPSCLPFSFSILSPLFFPHPVSANTSGMCPGPALVNLVQPSAQGVTVVAAMLVGMLWTPVLAQVVGGSSSTAVDKAA